MTPGASSGSGAPCRTSSVYVLDAHLQPIPVGVPGELYVGGKLARGYLGRPELTDERFIANPFSEAPDARLYRTGDRARYHGDGTLEFLGRADHQVKLRGVRIELGEIEAVLEQHSAVGQAVAVVREDTVGDRRLVAYVTPAAEAAPAPRDLRDFLKQKLPAYMLPSAIVTLAALPLSPNGKVDRGALPPPAPGASAADRGGARPATPTERLIAAIWEDVLGTPDVRVDDNFFDLGGHSLLAVQVLDRLEKATGVKPRPTDLFLQTLGQLASACDRRARVPEPSARARAPREDLRHHHAVAFRSPRRPPVSIWRRPSRHCRCTGACCCSSPSSR